MRETRGAKRREEQELAKAIEDSKRESKSTDKMDVDEAKNEEKGLFKCHDLTYEEERDPFSSDEEEEQMDDENDDDFEPDSDEDKKKKSKTKSTPKKRQKTKRKRVIDDDDDFEYNDESPPKKNERKRRKVVEDDEENEESKPSIKEEKIEVKQEPGTENPSKKVKIKEEPTDEIMTTPVKSRAGKKTRTRRKVVEDDEDAPKKEIKVEDDQEENSKKKTMRNVKKEVKEEEEEEKTPKKKSKKKKKEEEEETPKKKSKKKKEEEGEETKKKGKRKKKEEEEEEQYKWWEEHKDIKIEKGSQMWKTLKHNGPIFAPEYEPHGVKILYDGEPVELTPEQEEIATFFAVMRESEYYTKEVFRKNFWNDWKAVLGKKHKIKCLDKCDFTPIWEWHLAQKEKKEKMSKEEKRALREKKEKEEEPYKYCEIDGRKEQVANYKIEPPGLFRGRGAHPKQGKVKRRIYPEDVIINIGDPKDAPKPPKGHKWKEVISDNTVMWLAMWKDPINGGCKYMQLAASSSLKGMKDMQKYEIARKLKKHVDRIRKDYRKKWKSKSLKEQQFAVAVYFIDKLALRAGTEKDEDAADTVGCCSLRVEHIELKDDNVIKFDFLGKDSIRYLNEVKVDEQVYKCVKKFIKGKKPGDLLFDQINTAVLNKHLKEYMENLTAKVFRTYNASLTLDQQLRKDEESLKDKSEAEKLEYYNNANREVAILCNHQRSVPKTFTASMENIDAKIEELKEYKKRLQKAWKKVEKKGYETVKEKWDKEEAKKIENFEKAMKEYEKEKEELQARRKKGEIVTIPKPPKKPPKRALPKTEATLEKRLATIDKQIKNLEVSKRVKDENKTVALGTSRINYCDPRITVAWCKRHNVPVTKIFSKTLMKKFPWAMGVDENFKF